MENAANVVTCPYCGQPAVLVTGADIYKGRPDLTHKFFWRCAPCEAYVGCHPTGKGKRPLGGLANANLRMWRSNTHTVFDVFWKGRPGRNARSIFYERLAGELGIEKQDCHIGMFDIDTCKRVIQICAKWRLSKGDLC